MPPIIVHQAKEQSQHIHFNIPLNQIVYHAPSGYMDRDGLLKSTTQFSNVCDTSPVNNHILFFNGQGSHFDEHALRQIKCRNIQPFLMKSNNLINDQHNDNVPNDKLKSLYNLAKAAWMLKYRTTHFLYHHMKSILVEARYAFKLSSGNIVRDSFAKQS